MEETELLEALYAEQRAAAKGKTAEELEALSAEIKVEIMRLKAQRRAIADERKDLLTINYLAQRLKMDVGNIKPEDATALLEIARRSRQPGDVVVTPDAATIAIAADAAEVSDE